MAGRGRWKLAAKRWIRFFVPLILIALVIGIYIAFLNFIAGRMSTDMDSFNDFVIYSVSVAEDITSVSEAELAAEQTERAIEKEGERQSARDRIFEIAASGETYISETTGHLCTKFTYQWYGMECVIVYDPESAKLHEDGTDYSGAITDSIIAAKSDSIKY